MHALNPALIQPRLEEGDDLDEGLLQNDDLARMVVFLLQQPRRMKVDDIGMWGF